MYLQQNELYLKGVRLIVPSLMVDVECLVQKVVSLTL